MLPNVPFEVRKVVVSSPVAAPPKGGLARRLTTNGEVEAVSRRFWLIRQINLPLPAYLRESGRDPKFSGRYGRMHQSSVVAELK